MSAFSTYGSSSIGDTGLALPRGIDLKTWHPLPNGHSNGNMLRMSDQRPVGPGHNSGTGDPGIASDFDDRGPLAIRKGSVPPEKLDAFYEAVRSQGDAGVRQAAISNTLARARANPAIKHHDYRLLEQIASCSRWEYRYCCQSNKALAYFAAQADPKNIGRSLSSLAGAGVIAGVDVPRQIGGWPVTYYTIRCTAEDRSNQTLGNLNEAFKAAVSSRQPDDLLPSSRPPDDPNPGQVVPETTCKSSGGGVASRPPDAQSVNSRSVDNSLPGSDAPGARATDLFAEGAPDERTLAKPKRKSPAPKATEEQFTRLWAAYPIREGKAAALKNFLKLTGDEAELAIFGAAQYAAKIAAERERLARRGEEPRIKWAQGWLTERRFEDFAEAYAAATGVAPDDPETEFKRYVASPDGQAVIREHGPEKGMRIIRDIVLGRYS